MKFILGSKLEMTQKYKDDGTVIPVTKIFANPCTVVQIKTRIKDGYSALQVGCGKAKHINKPLKGHLKGQNVHFLREFRIDENQEKNYHVGDIIDVKSFVKGDVVDVSGTTKGRGFQGVVKRWGFSGQPSSHGHKDQSRMPGSSGAGGIQHVHRGHKMGGRMGGQRVTVKNLQVVDVDAKNNWIFVKGAIPGAKDGLLIISGKK